jgi:hypothetical protein
LKPNLNTQADGAIRLYTGEGIFSIEKCIELSTPFIQLGREFIKSHNIPKWFLSEIYCHLKKAGDLPELPEERKREIWKESGKDKLLAYSLYLVEVI